MLTQRIEAIRQNYVNTKPQISCERAKIWTDSHRETEGQPVAIRRARAFYDCCDRLGVPYLCGRAGGGGHRGVSEVWYPHPGVLLDVGGPGDGHL